MAETHTGNGQPPNWAQDVSAWRERARLHVELPSGMRVVMRTLSLDELAASNALPQSLLRVALAEASTGEGAAGLMADKIRSGGDKGVEEAREIAQDLALLVRHVVAQALLEPTLRVEELDGLPEEDLDMVAGLASRRLSFDAAGRRVGVEPLDTFATFRGEHGCDEGCAACEASRLAFSTVHGG